MIGMGYRYTRIYYQILNIQKYQIFIYQSNVLPDMSMILWCITLFMSQIKFKAQIIYTHWQGNSYFVTLLQTFN